MTKMQIIARATLSALGLLLVARLLAGCEHILALSTTPERAIPVVASVACLAATALAASA